MLKDQVPNIDMMGQYCKDFYLAFLNLRGTVPSQISLEHLVRVRTSLTNLRQVVTNETIPGLLREIDEIIVIKQKNDRRRARSKKYFSRLRNLVDDLEDLSELLK